MLFAYVVLRPPSATEDVLNSSQGEFLDLLYEVVWARKEGFLSYIMKKAKK